MPLGDALEAYTRKRPGEVLLVRVLLDGSEEEVLVFRGASSFLTRPTPADPGQPVIPAGAQLLGVERQRAPFSPVNPQVIAAGLQGEELATLLAEVGIDL
ncbi:MAG: hypothetical protein KME03_09920 [Aphanocapsa lilacina HA4352-LM1]|jgi:hypothetical protein|nr:hypothetical protein [Aphanocapsa lilacina HA4352-LM1]